MSCFLQAIIQAVCLAEKLWISELKLIRTLLWFIASGSKIEVTEKENYNHFMQSIAFVLQTVTEMSKGFLCE